MDLSGSDLWTAVLAGKFDLATKIIYCGGNVNETRKTEFHPATTLLHYAVANNYVQCIHMLAKLGANFNAGDSKNRTPLHWAVMFHPELIEVLIKEGAAVDARDHNQMTPLHHVAIRHKCIGSAQKLIERGASINAIGANGLSVLHVAVMCHNLKMVKILIKHKVNINVMDIHGHTPLLRHFTTRGPKMKITELLLQNGADINAKTHKGNKFPLFLTAKFNRPDSLHLLLRWGACVNESTNTGETALHVACKNGLTDVTALLLKFGADLNVCNQDGKTPSELLPDSPSSECTAKIIIREAAKRESVDQLPGKGYQQMVQSCEKYWKFYKECCDELTEMVFEQLDIEDSTISFYDILLMDEQKLATLDQYEKIATAFKSSSSMSSFRIYANDFNTKFEEANKQVNCLKIVANYLGDTILESFEI